jgi:hypothetical protein
MDYSSARHGPGMLGDQISMRSSGGEHTVFDSCSRSAGKQYITGLPERGIFTSQSCVGGRIIGLQTLEPFATYPRL